jgi:DtxR family Mn-dependent transcriptional regulator
MLPPEIEDCLEAILTITTSNHRPATRAEIGEATGFDAASVDACIDAMQTKGFVVGDSDRGLELTDAGRVLGERVARKHRVLECFFSEMLGMDADRASEEACKLEHEVSDEAINRLSTVIRGPCQNPGRCGWKHCMEAGASRSLLDYEEGADVRVTMVRGHGRNRRLIDLGIVPGESIHIRRKLRNNSVVVRIKGCDVAISPEVAGMIHVEKIE